MKYYGPYVNRNFRGAYKYFKELRALARKNRSNPTEAENILWVKVLSKDKTGFRFLRQKPLGRFILDYYCSKLLLAIEVDGGIHDKKKNRDEGRDEMMTTLGILTIRYTNDEVINRLNWLKKNLAIKIEERRNGFGLPFIKGRRLEEQRDLVE